MRVESSNLSELNVKGGVDDDAALGDSVVISAVGEGAGENIIGATDVNFVEGVVPDDFDFAKDYPNDAWEALSVQGIRAEGAERLKGDVAPPCDLRSLRLTMIGSHRWHKRVRFEVTGLTGSPCLLAA